MPQGKQTPKAEIAKILSAYRKGTSTAELAKKHGVPQRTIQEWAQAAGKPKKKAPAKKKPAAKKAVKKPPSAKAKKATKKPAAPAKKKPSKKRKTKAAKGKELLKKVTGPVKRGVGRPAGPVLKITDSELLRQRKEGASVAELSKTHGVSTNTVLRHLAKADEAPKRKDSLDGFLKLCTEIMGQGIMNSDTLLAELKKRRRTPKAPHPRKYLIQLLCTRKDTFEAVPKAQGGGRGVYRIKNAAKTKTDTTHTHGKIRVEALSAKTRKWKAMKKIWDLCERAGVKAPPEVINYFGGEGRSPADGAVTQLADFSTLSPKEQTERVLYVNLQKLPRGTKRLRIEF